MLSSRLLSSSVSSISKTMMGTKTSIGTRAISTRIGMTMMPTSMTVW